MHKVCVIREKLEFEDYENVLDVTQLENNINHLEKNKVNLDNLKKDHNELIKNDELILKPQQRFRSRKNVFTEKVNKIALIASNDKIL